MTAGQAAAAGPAQHGPAQDGQARDGAARDGAAQDGQARDGAAWDDGQAPDGAARDGQAQDGAAQDGPRAPQWLRDLAAALARAPVPSRLQPPDEGGRKSAILILFGLRPGANAAQASAGDLDLLYIQRRAGLRRHGGQPAFPGGAIEPADPSPVQAALREAAEEVGLDPAGVEVVAAGPDLFIEHSGFQVTPVLGWWRRPVPVRVTDPAEVAGASRVRISELTDPANRLMVRHPSGFTGPAFRVSGMLVWGFTAALTDGLLRLGGWELAWDRGNVQDLPPDMLAAAVPDEAGEPGRS